MQCYTQLEIYFTIKLTKTLTFGEYFWPWNCNVSHIMYKIVLKCLQAIFLISLQIIDH